MLFPHSHCYSCGQQATGGHKWQCIISCRLFEFTAYYVTVALLVKRRISESQVAGSSPGLGITACLGKLLTPVHLCSVLGLEPQWSCTKDLVVTYGLMVKGKER